MELEKRYEKELDPRKVVYTPPVQKTYKTTSDFSSIKELFFNLRKQSDEAIYDALSALDNKSLQFIEDQCGFILRPFFLKDKVSATIEKIIKERKEEEDKLNAEDQLISSWIHAMNQVPGYVFPDARSDRLRLATQFKTQVESISSITAVSQFQRNIMGYYNAIPSDTLDLIVQLLPPPDPPSGSSSGDVADADILRYYVLKASKSHKVGDALMFVVEKTLKRMLEVSFLPLPSVTTVLLLCDWCDMLYYLTQTHYGKSLSRRKIVNIAISILAVLMQLLNRETPLSFVKYAYSGTVQIKDILSNLPTDVKKWLKRVLGMLNVDDAVLNLALKNRIITFNNHLGYFAGIDNLSMNKALDMLYTFRVGDAFVKYATKEQGLEIDSLSDYWEKYGPLPEDGKQVEALLDLFRNDKKTYNERVEAIYSKYRQAVADSASYEGVLGYCGKIYEEMSQLNMHYLPFTCRTTQLFEILPKTDHGLISMIAGWAKNNSKNEKLTGISQAKVSEDIFHSITEWVENNK